MTILALMLKVIIKLTSYVVFIIVIFNLIFFFIGTTEYIFYCKRAILFLSSSKILTPHRPLRPAILSFPRNKGGGEERGDILEEQRNRIALFQ
jgi:hypothetical protein